MPKAEWVIVIDREKVRTLKYSRLILLAKGTLIAFHQTGGRGRVSVLPAPIVPSPLTNDDAESRALVTAAKSGYRLQKYAFH
jgi:hypothetical protein